MVNLNWSSLHTNIAFKYQHSPKCLRREHSYWPMQKKYLLLCSNCSSKKEKRKGRFIHKARCILKICFRDIKKVCSTEYVEIDNASDWHSPASPSLWLVDTELRVRWVITPNQSWVRHNQSPHRSIWGILTILTSPPVSDWRQSVGLTHDTS